MHIKMRLSFWAEGAVAGQGLAAGASARCHRETQRRVWPELNGPERLMCHPHSLGQEVECFVLQFKKKKLLKGKERVRESEIFHLPVDSSDVCNS